MELHLNIIGCSLIVLGLVHIIFPKFFNWRSELKPLSLINRQVMKVHTFFIALTVTLMGLLCVTSATELMATALGKKVAIGLGFFWTCRLFIQWFGYSSQLWKGKRFETVVHVLFTLFWIYFSAVFWMVGMA